ncbi:hypothetical protein BB560_002379 [Smittium megazygosporum]|uniref:Uncharacterized protein n=1 Tax=Smittium megazygosporum TaxID=133381 RepID=A0A2T9ZEZ5_9FUNG|nr:hypothetical protein BB560_002379 [Smittium megazygosporum]
MYLIVRQLFIVIVFVAYVIFISWGGKNSKPSAKLLWKSSPESRLSFPKSNYFSSKNHFESWLEPKAFLRHNSTKVKQQDGMYYIMMNSHLKVLDSQVMTAGMTRELNPDTLEASPRRLGFLYTVVSDEKITYYARIYNIDSSTSLAEKDFAAHKKKVEAINPNSFNPTDFPDLKVCPPNISGKEYDPELLFCQDKFSSCVGKSNSRENDVFYFRISSSLKPYSKVSDGALELHSNSGAYIEKENLRFSDRFVLSLIPSSYDSNINVLASESWLDSANFKFKISVLQNFTSTKSSDEITDQKPNINKSSNEMWEISRMVQYSLKVGKKYSLLSDLEKELICIPPAVDTASRTVVIYFYISQVVLTLDTIWEPNKNGQLVQIQNLSSKNLYNSDIINEYESTGISLDDSGKLLVISKLNGDFFVFSRKANVMKPNQLRTNTNVDASEKFPMPSLNQDPKEPSAFALKPTLRKITDPDKSPFTWDLILNWHESSYLGELTDFHNYSNDQHTLNMNTGYNSLIGFQHVSSNLRSRSAEPLPGSVKYYYAALRTVLIDSSSKEEDSPSKDTDAVQSYPLSLFFKRKNHCHPYLLKAKARVMAIKFDGTIVYFSLDERAPEPNFVLSYAYSHYEVLILLTISTLFFMYYESKVL